MQIKNIIIEIEFNSRSKSNNRWQVGMMNSWIDYRMSIFMKITLQSLKKQTNQNFTALISHASASTDLIQEALNQYEPLPSNIQFIPRNSNVKIQEKISQDHDELYLVKLDCDDAYHKSYIQQLQDYRPNPGTCALINQEGYLYDSVNHRIAAITSPSPNFYAWIYKTEDYFKGTRYNISNRHKKVIKYPHEILTNDDKRNYLIVVHEWNTKNQNLLTRYELETKRSKVNAVLDNFI